MTSNNRLNYHSDDGKTFNVGGNIQMQPGAKLVQADGRELNTSLGPAISSNTIVIFGDSETAVSTNVTPSNVSNVDYGWFTWLQVFNGHSFKLLNNAGVAGDTSQQLLDRIQTDVLRFNPSWVSVLVGINDIRNGVPLATTISNVKQIYNILLSKGIRVAALSVYPVYTGLGGLTPAITAAITALNIAIKEFCANNPNMVFVNAHASLIDATSTTGVALAGMLRTDNLHTTAKGARAVGQAAHNALSKFITSPSHHVSTWADQFSFDSSSTQFLTNPTFRGTAGLKQGVATGTVADDWVVSFANVDGASSVASVVPRTVAVDGDNIGNNQKVVFVSTGASSVLNVKSLNVGPTLSPGDSFYLEAFVGASDMSAVSYINLDMYFNGSPQALHLAGLFQTLTTFDQTDFVGCIRTPTYKIPPGTVISDSRHQILVGFTGVGGITLTMGRASLVKV